MLPIKAAGIVMIYSFYFTRWIIEVRTVLDLEVEAVESFFWVYVGVNVVVAGLLLAMRRLPLALIQWLVFAIILVDGVFLSALTDYGAGRFEQAANRLREAGKLGLRDRRLGPLIGLSLFKAGQRLVYQE